MSYYENNALQHSAFQCIDKILARLDIVCQNQKFIWTQDCWYTGRKGRHAEIYSCFTLGFSAYLYTKFIYARQSDISVLIK